MLTHISPYSPSIYDHKRHHTDKQGWKNRENGKLLAGKFCDWEIPPRLQKKKRKKRKEKRKEKKKKKEKRKRKKTVREIEMIIKPT